MYQTRINPRRPAASAGLSISPDHYWNLDDDGVWADSVGSWDFVENGTVTVSSTGPNGQDVAVFDTSLDYLKMTKNPYTEGYTSNISISYWAKWDSFNTGNYGNYGLSWRTSGTYYAFDSGYAGTTFDAFQFRGPALTVASNATAISAATGTWYHIAGVWDGSNQVLYVNGISYDSKANSNSIVNIGMGLNFGNANHNANTQFYGQGALVGLWNGVLTAADITYLYNSGNGRRFEDL